jgi:hypothetical protein
MDVRDQEPREREMALGEGKTQCGHLITNTPSL